MENNIGVRIRELRKKKGLTQEALASLLSVTSQAVSKWEMNTACPDISLLPMIAGIFEVSIDTLFGYEKNELEKRIDTILQKVNQYNRFWNRPDEAEQILKDGLKEYPSNSRLLSQLMELYECHMRNNRDITHLDDIITIGEKLIQQSDDFVLVCAAKTNLSSAYLRKGEYSAAKKILESLPYSVATRNVQISFQLSGEDRYSAASDVYTEEIQSLYIACAQKGKGCYEVGRYEEGLECYQKEEQVILLFMRKNEISPEAYLWDGMQTHHWFSHLGQAACWNKLGNSEKCTEHVMIAKKIISKAWNDFEADRKCYMTPFNQYLCELELDQFTETL